MPTKLEILQNEYCELQVIKNYLIGILNDKVIAEFDLGFFFKNEVKRLSDDQLKIKKQIEKLCK